MTFPYANLDDAVGKMQRAAIDCHMADQQFYPNWSNEMIYAKWGFMLTPQERRLGDPPTHGPNCATQAGRRSSARARRACGAVCGVDPVREAGAAHGGA